MLGGASPSGVSWTGLLANAASMNLELVGDTHSESEATSFTVLSEMYKVGMIQK